MLADQHGTIIHMSKLHQNFDLKFQDVHLVITLRTIFAYDARTEHTVSLIELIGATPVHEDSLPRLHMEEPPAQIVMLNVRFSTF